MEELWNYGCSRQPYISIVLVLDNFHDSLCYNFMVTKSWTSTRVRMFWFSSVLYLLVLSILCHTKEHIERWQQFALQSSHPLSSRKIYWRWRRKWHPTPVFLPGESHEQRSLVGYGPRGRKESGTTERPYFTLLYFTILKKFPLLLKPDESLPQVPPAVLWSSFISSGFTKYTRKDARIL